MHRILAFTLLLIFFSLPARAYRRDESSARSWHEDLSYLRAEAPKRHKDLFHNLTPQQFAQLVDDLDRRVSSLQDYEIIVGLARIVASFGSRDGHTYMNLMSPSLGFHKLPLNLYSYADGIFVRAASKDYKDLAGAQLISIEGMPAAEAVARVSEITSADNAMTKRAWAPDLLSVTEILRALKIAPGTPASPVTIEVQLSDGTRRQNRIDPLPSLDQVEWIDTRFVAPQPALYLRWASLNPFERHGARKNFWFEYMSESKTLYVNYSAVADAPEESVDSFFGRVFDFSDKNPVEKFVIDVRQNGGGNNYLNRPIFYGLIKRDQTIARRGTFFVIIGRRTFSAAQNLVNMLDQHTQVTFVGEPTGGSPNHFGDPTLLQLPNSKVALFLSSVWWQDLDPRDSREWIAPHIAADLTSSDERLGRDPALEAVLNYLPETPLTDRMRQALDRGGKSAAQQTFILWRSETQHKYLTGEAELNRLGASLFGERKSDQAVAVFEINASVNPDSWLAHNSLGRAYAAIGRKETANAEYQRALKIRPNAPETLSAIDRLNGSAP
jgi:tetratricopeptide (TPR) repeat protein